MAAAQYYNPDSFAHDQQHLLSNEKDPPHSPPGPQSPLRPLHLITQYQGGHHRTMSYEKVERLREIEREDMYLKARIRRMRFVSRILAFLISVAVLVPITMTLVKFLSTQNTYRDVTNAQGKTVSRTAWAHDTKAWPTYMYFTVAVVSVVLNFITVFSYKFGVDKANKANYITSVFSYVIMFGNLVIWSIAAALYRTERDKNGKTNDLWGWTCSAAAQAIQKDFAHEVDFNTYCNAQTASFYIGCVQAGAAAFSGIILIFVILRNRSKSNVQNQMRLSGFEPSRI